MKTNFDGHIHLAVPNQRIANRCASSFEPSFHSNRADTRKSQISRPDLRNGSRRQTSAPSFAEDLLGRNYRVFLY